VRSVNSINFLWYLSAPVNGVSDHPGRTAGERTKTRAVWPVLRQILKISTSLRLMLAGLLGLCGMANP